MALEPETLEDDDLLRVEQLAAGADVPVLEFVEQLPESQRQAVRSRFVDDREYDEIVGVAILLRYGPLPVVLTATG